MELRILVRPAVQLLAAARGAALGPLLFFRSHQLAARTKRTLKLPPHDSFLPDRSATYPAADSVIYNPPASEASPHHTPFIFLPPNDARRRALEELRVLKDASAAANACLPPALRYRCRNPRYHLNADDMAEMRRLRIQDPVKWSVGHLAKKFDCSPIFVCMVAPPPPGHLEWLKAKLERKMSRWGPIRRQAREDRKRRAEMLYRGEL